jgi:alpha-ketoglutarate-dependent taurine dioxygenase
MSNTEREENFQILSNYEAPLEKNAIMDQIKDKGFVTFSGVNSIRELANLAEQLGDPIIHRDSLYRGVITLKPVEGEHRPDYSGFTYNAQSLHTDGSTVAEPASLLLFCCETPASRGGISLLLDGKVLYAHLQKQDPELLAALEQPEAGTFGKEQYKAPVFSRPLNNIVSIRFRNDTLVTYSPNIQAKFIKLITMMDTLKLKIPLKRGQGYILNNRRVLHGRTPLEGPRVVHRVQVKAKPSFNLVPGFEIDTGESLRQVV